MFAATHSAALSAKQCQFNSNTISAKRMSVAPVAGRSTLEVVAKKKWEKQAMTKNGLPVRIPMHVKTNDKVIVIAGADKGKVTNVVEVFTKTGEVLCKDVNIKTKHIKPRGEGETGQIIQREFPIAHSNVMHYSEAQSVRSRIGTKMVDGKKKRVLKKTGEVLAN
uniref:Large ribosomal subunit protein uL24 C-terminal domain-containing protein n=2 Tax=Ostreococcus mediterraneus TaxID=1486918 RepID=A0A6U0EYL7_9CHLO